MMEKIKFSTREWYGMLGAVAWGAVIGLIPAENSGPFIAALVGPPVAFLMLPKRPFLSWQLSIGASALAIAIMSRDPQDPSDPVFGPAILMWTATALFSLPWPFIFYRRAQRAKEKGDSSAGGTMPYVGAALLVFLACGLIILGSILSVLGILHPFAASQATASDRVAPFIGCLLATAGIGLAVQLCRRTGKLQISEIVEELIGLLLAFLSFTLIPMIWMGMSDARPCASGNDPCTPVRGSDLFWPFVILVESVVVLVWLIRRGRRTKAAALKAG